MKRLIVLFFSIPLLVFSNMTPFTETYWSSSQNFESLVEEIPISPRGIGIQVINLGFGDYSLDEKGNLREVIDKVHQKEGIIKLSFDGMSRDIQTIDEAEVFAERVAQMVLQNDFDGLNFSMERQNIAFDLQLAVLKKCREILGYQKWISYTIPSIAKLEEDAKATLELGQRYLDSVTIKAFHTKEDEIYQDMIYLTELGIPRQKMVYGIMPGLEEDAKEVAHFVLENELGGVMILSLDGSFIEEVSEILAEEN